MITYEIVLTKMILKSLALLAAVAVASSSYGEQEQKIFGAQQEHQVESAERSFTYNDLFGLTKLQQSVVSPDGANILLQVSKYNTSTDATASRVVLSQLEGDKLSYPAEKLDFNRGNGFADKESNPMWFSNTKYGFIKKATGEMSGDYVVLKDVENKSLSVEQKLPFVPDNLQFDINSGRFTFTYRVYPGMSIEETIAKDKSLGDDINKVHVFDKIYIRRWDTWDDHKVSRVFATEPVALHEFAEYDFECLILNAENLMKLVDESKSTPTEPFGGASDYAWDSQSGKLLFVSPTYYNESRQAYSTSTNVYVVSNSTFECVSCGKYKEGAKSSPKLYRGEGYNYTWLEMRRPKYEADTNILVMGNLESKEMFTVLSSCNYSILSYVMSEKFDRTVFLLTEDAGESVLFRYNLTGTMGGPVKILRLGSISELKLVPSANKDSEVLLLTSSTMNRPAELFRLEVFVDQDSDYIFDRLTFLNEIEEQYGLQEPEKFWFNGAKNEKVMGWLIKPAHFNPNKKYPLAFLIHGGPESAWHDSFSYRWNPQIFASSDYFVAMVNFHGSTGYGQDFVDSIHGNWGSYPFEDNILGLKHVLKSNPSIDSEKVCALGASYGGYMINWLNGNAPEGTFKCLVNHDGLFDLTSMYYATEELYFPEFSVDNKDSDSKHAYPPYHSKHTQKVYDKWSPSRYVSNWKTPTLVIHGGRDYRVPITEGIMTFTALQRKGIKSRLVVFEEENHWILKSKNGLKWHNEVLGWLAEFLH